jgi:transcriptional regulator with XRE-family HTH domain
MGMKLAQYLRREKLKPAEFAARLKKPASTISRLLNGDRKGGIALLEEIAIATGGEVTPNDFMVSADTHPSPFSHPPTEAA